jgi:DNA-binding transcriptional LysR family regulator
MDRFVAMTTLLAVVEAGSLSGASRRLGTPLATVSRRISDLESHLGTRLLTRSSRHLALTEAGRAYVAASRRILEQVGEAEREAAGEYRAPKGELILTAPIVFGRLHVLPVVTEFLRAYPEIDIRMRLADRMLNLLAEQVDLAVRIGELPDSSLVATRVGAIRRVVCGSPAYFAARGTPRHPNDLAAHHCVTFEGLSSPTAWRFHAGRTELSVPIRSRLAVTTAEAAVDAAIAGLGITRVLSYQMAEALRTGRLAITLADFEPPPPPVSLVHAGQPPVALKLRAFLDFALPRLTARVAQAAV